jgi:hypothetical protein
MPSLTGAFIEEQRRLAGLSRSQLAVRLGYTNLAKGANRIVRLERDGELPPDLLRRIVSALALDAERVRLLVDADERRARQAWEQWADEPVAPVLRFRPLPAVWCGEALPVGLTRDEAIAHARARAVERQWRYVLMWNRRETVWCDPDGLSTTSAMNSGR